METLKLGDAHNDIGQNKPGPRLGAACGRGAGLTVQGTRRVQRFHYARFDSMARRDAILTFHARYQVGPVPFREEKKKGK